WALDSPLPTAAVSPEPGPSNSSAPDSPLPTAAANPEPGSSNSSEPDSALPTAAASPEPGPCNSSAPDSALPTAATNPEPGPSSSRHQTHLCQQPQLPLNQVHPTARHQTHLCQQPQLPLNQVHPAARHQTHLCQQPQLPLNQVHPTARHQTQLCQQLQLTLNQVHPTAQHQTQLCQQLHHHVNRSTHQFCNRFGCAHRYFCSSKSIFEINFRCCWLPKGKFYFMTEPFHNVALLLALSRLALSGKRVSRNTLPLGQYAQTPTVLVLLEKLFAPGEDVTVLTVFLVERETSVVIQKEFKLLEECQAREKKEEAERQAREKKEEAERQERREKEEADRKERLELEKMKQDAEMKLLQAKIEAGIIRNEPDGSGARSSDAGAKHPKLPNFQDGRDDLDIWLTRCERFAVNNGWSREKWSSSLCALLTGCALDCYGRLSAEQARDYEKVKEALKKRYDLTKDGYRRKFRTCKPAEGESPDMFIARIVMYLDR
ncbi:cell surface glycoprotein 1, partial [Plakobranchus ocellatus]